jgi:hypothetical protein
MMQLKQSLAAWGREDFTATFKREVEALDPHSLPLQQGLSGTSQVADQPFHIIVIGQREEPGCLRVKAGVHYAGLLAGCSCADDPSTVEPEPEYCELCFEIDPVDASARVSLASAKG